MGRCPTQYCSGLSSVVTCSGLKRWPHLPRPVLRDDHFLRVFLAPVLRNDRFLRVLAAPVLRDDHFLRVFLAPVLRNDRFLRVTLLAAPVLKDDHFLRVFLAPVLRNDCFLRVLAAPVLKDDHFLRVLFLAPVLRNDCFLRVLLAPVLRDDHFLRVFLVLVLRNNRFLRVLLAPNFHGVITYSGLVRWPLPPCIACPIYLPVACLQRELLTPSTWRLAPNSHILHSFQQSQSTHDIFSSPHSGSHTLKEAHHSPGNLLVACSALRLENLRLSSLLLALIVPQVWWLLQDGARLWKACAAYWCPLTNLCVLFDSISVSFYKRLGGLSIVVRCSRVPQNSLRRLGSGRDVYEAACILKCQIQFHPKQSTRIILTTLVVVFRGAGSHGSCFKGGWCEASEPDLIWSPSTWSIISESEGDGVPTAMRVKDEAAQEYSVSCLRKLHRPGMEVVRCTHNFTRWEVMTSHTSVIE